jgi:hypothetical protein
MAYSLLLTEDLCMTTTAIIDSIIILSLVLLILYGWWIVRDLKDEPRENVKVPRHPDMEWARGLTRTEKKVWLDLLRTIAALPFAHRTAIHRGITVSLLVTRIELQTSGTTPKPVSTETRKEAELTASTTGMRSVN